MAPSQLIAEKASAKLAQLLPFLTNPGPNERALLKIVLVVHEILVWLDAQEQEQGSKEQS
jgi:hypothetical protein